MKFDLDLLVQRETCARRQLYIQNNKRATVNFEKIGARRNVGLIDPEVGRSGKTYKCRQQCRRY